MELVSLRDRPFQAVNQVMDCTFHLAVNFNRIGLQFMIHDIRDYIHARWRDYDKPGRIIWTK